MGQGETGRLKGFIIIQKHVNKYTSKNLLICSSHLVMSYFLIPAAQQNYQALQQAS